MIDNKIVEMYNEINKGYTYKSKNGMARISLSYTKYFISYRNYGSSSIKNTIDNFTWLMNNIMKKYNNDFIKEDLHG